jgi:hypothetical protein
VAPLLAGGFAATNLVSLAHAQTNLQLWGNVTLDWVKSDRLVYELDFEPKQARYPSAIFCRETVANPI